MKKDLELFSEHLKKVAKDAKCPICNCENWAFQGISHFTRYADIMYDLGPRVTPVAQLFCDNCYYVMQFIWQPIMSKI